MTPTRRLLPHPRDRSPWADTLDLDLEAVFSVPEREAGLGRESLVNSPHNGHHLSRR